MVIKSYIFRIRCLNETLTIQGLLLDINTHLITLKYLDTKRINLKTPTESVGKVIFYNSDRLVKHLGFFFSPC